MRAPRVRHLHLVLPDENVRTEAFRLGGVQGLRDRVQRMRSRNANPAADGVGPVAMCCERTWVYDLPSGGAMQRGGFELNCIVRKNHVGHCLDATGITFNALAGIVADWGEYTDDDVIRLEEELA